jgi:hypothetical protein
VFSLSANRVVLSHDFEIASAIDHKILRMRWAENLRDRKLVASSKAAIANMGIDLHGQHAQVSRQSVSASAASDDAVVLYAMQLFRQPFSHRVHAYDPSKS